MAVAYQYEGCIATGKHDGGHRTENSKSLSFSGSKRLFLQYRQPRDYLILLLALIYVNMLSCQPKNIYLVPYLSVAGGQKQA